MQHVAPARERGLKCWLDIFVRYASQVAPARERGLKYKVLDAGAQEIDVAPARERGLKFLCADRRFELSSRSREGAWIEI